MGDQGIKGFTEKNLARTVSIFLLNRLRSLFPLYRNYSIDFQFLGNNIYLTVLIFSKHIAWESSSQSSRTIVFGLFAFALLLLLNGYFTLLYDKLFLFSQYYTAKACLYLTLAIESSINCVYISKNEILLTTLFCPMDPAFSILDFCQNIWVSLNMGIWVNKFSRQSLLAFLNRNLK